MENILPWFLLKSVPGIGNLIFRRLCDRFESPENVFSASFKDLLQVEGVTERLARAILRHRISDSVRADLERVRQKGIRIVTLADREYPHLLRQIPDPPPLLYFYGTLPQTRRSIAIVGSRNATGYGLSTARRLSTDLAALGLTVVSGMAIGIDTAAHEGALQAGGQTVAVLGSGLLRIYPRQNIKLAQQIAENGAVTTEFATLTEPSAHNFPARNRIISGMCLGTVVVEASRKSGSLITARLALEQNREVFAVPGNVTSFKSMGTHSLIKNGAKLVVHVDDILEEITHGLQACAETGRSAGNPDIKSTLALTPDESQVLQLLEPYPLHIDQLVRRSGFGAGKLSSLLLQLELKGLVEQTPGKLFNLITDQTEG